MASCEEPRPQVGASSKEKANSNWGLYPQIHIGYSSPRTAGGILAFSHKSRFTEFFIQANGLGKNGFDEWLFLPGMLFLAPDKWWGNRSKRDHPHEGLDLGLYRDRQGNIRQLEEATQIPAKGLNDMQPGAKGIEFETGDVTGIPILSCFSSDEDIGSRPLIILSHAFQSSKEFWQDKMLSLARAGYYTVALDNRGHGERKGPDFRSQVFEIDGFNLYEVRRLIKETADDIPILIDHFITHENVDAERIGMIGVSMGGFVAFRALVIDNRIGVAAPVIASPYLDERPRDVPLVNRPEINRALDDYSREFSPANYPRHFYPRAVLIQVGGQDKHLDADRVRLFYEKLKPYYRRAPAKLMFIQEENSGHEFTASMWRNVTKWFKEHLQTKIV